MLADPGPVPHPGPIAGRPLDVAEEKSIRPYAVICRRCDVGTRELHCWNCGQLPLTPVPLPYTPISRGMVRQS